VDENMKIGTDIWFDLCSKSNGNWKQLVRSTTHCY